MGRIAAPIPIPGSITNTSVTLEWKWNSTAVDVGWLHLNPSMNVSLKWCHSQQQQQQQQQQQKTEMCSTWEAVPSVTGRSGQSLVTVNALRPYTSYRVSKAMSSLRSPHQSAVWRLLWRPVFDWTYVVRKLGRCHGSMVHQHPNPNSSTDIRYCVSVSASDRLGL